MSLRIVRGDVTLEEVDAIVSSLSPDAAATCGVELAIRLHGGEGVLDECRQKIAARGGAADGAVVVTGGGRLAARWVLHVKAPPHGPGSAATLARAYREALAQAAALGAQSIALPSLATGRRGHPAHEVARIAVRAARNAPSELRDVRLVLRGAATHRAFVRAFVLECCAPLGPH